MEKEVSRKNTEKEAVSGLVTEYTLLYLPFYLLLCGLPYGIQ